MRVRTLGVPGGPATQHQQGDLMVILATKADPEVLDAPAGTFHRARRAGPPQHSNTATPQHRNTATQRHSATAPQRHSDTVNRVNRVNGEVGRTAVAVDELVRSGRTSFSVSGPGHPSDACPTTEDRRKTVGGDQQRSSADVTVENGLMMRVTVHAEDHDDVDRGQADIGSGDEHRNPGSEDRTDDRNNPNTRPGGDRDTGRAGRTR